MAKNRKSKARFNSSNELRASVTRSGCVFAMPPKSASTDFDDNPDVDELGVSVSRYNSPMIVAKLSDEAGPTTPLASDTLCGDLNMVKVAIDVDFNSTITETIKIFLLTL